MDELLIHLSKRGVQRFDVWHEALFIHLESDDSDAGVNYICERQRNNCGVPKPCTSFDVIVKVSRKFLDDAVVVHERHQEGNMDRPMLDDPCGQRAERFSMALMTKISAQGFPTTRRECMTDPKLGKPRQAGGDEFQRK